MCSVKLQAVLIFRNTHKNRVTSCCSSSRNSTGRRSICQRYRHLPLFCSIKQKKNCGIPHFPPISNSWVSSILECNYTDFEIASIIFVPDQLQAWLERTYLLSVCVCVCSGRGRLSAYLVRAVRVWDLLTSSRTLRCVALIKYGPVTAFGKACRFPWLENIENNAIKRSVLCVLETTRKEDTLQECWRFCVHIKLRAGKRERQAWYHAL